VTTDLRRRVQLGVTDVVELGGGAGFTVTAAGWIPAIEPPRETWGLQKGPALPTWAPRPAADDSAPFFPATGIAIVLRLEWHQFGLPTPGLAIPGSTISVDLEAGVVPVEPVNRGPVPPNRR
jgi:hypothetical protein